MEVREGGHDHTPPLPKEEGVMPRPHLPYFPLGVRVGDSDHTPLAEQQVAAFCHPSLWLGLVCVDVEGSIGLHAVAGEAKRPRDALQGLPHEVFRGPPKVRWTDTYHTNQLPSTSQWEREAETMVSFPPSCQKRDSVTMTTLFHF